ncbi:probable E3 ubiquitin-protein ligase HERC1 [Ruditapes philippinarum]|uniref:probable E3 ubiquitin-protein ligase HERC1 n=1 Tax=Ruditapes philippinarum TaxID=129788 RepID=UPI00295B3E8F|nr:probable E3 ubiquitin-protein ligase HERC1 [Ruditapes philippinarum]
MSPAGSMLFHMLHSLMLVPQCRVVPLLNSLLTLLSNLDQICKLLTNIERFEKRELEQCFNSSVSAIWLVDLERVCSLLIGHCLGDMLIGPPITAEEKQVHFWMENKLFSNGLQENENKFEMEIEKIVEHILACPAETSLVYENICKEKYEGDKAVLLQLCCSVQTDTVVHTLRFMQETAESLDLDTFDVSNEPLLDTVSRFALAAIITHANMLETIVTKNITHHDDTFMSAVRQVYQLRLHLMNKKAFQQQTVSQMESFPTHTADRDTGEKSRRGDPDTDTNLDSDEEGEDGEIRKTSQNGSYEEECADCLRRSLFLILAVQPYWQVKSHPCSDNAESGKEKNTKGSLSETKQSVVQQNVLGSHKGSHPDLQLYLVSTDVTSNTKNGAATPDFSNKEGTGTGASLQKVKQTLRRLRWHHEHSGDVTLGRKQGRRLPHSISGDVCSFIKGDNLNHQRGKKRNASLKNVSYSVIEDIMKMQHDRAESRLYALNQIRELLMAHKEKTDADRSSPVPKTLSTLLCSAHLCLLSGCFNLGLLAGPQGEKIPRIAHYKDDIMSAKAETQREIQLAAHDIYESLVEGLLLTYNNKHNQGTRQRLLLCTIFSLSISYKAVDISLLVACRLLPTLYEMASLSAPIQGLVQPIRGRLGQVQLNTVLRVASFRLIQIVSLTTSVHSGPLSSGVLQSVLDMLWFQIQKHLDNPGYHSNAMAIFLVFTRRVLSAGKLKTLAATKKWTDMLISIIKESKQGQSLRTKLAAISILESILLACKTSIDGDFFKQVISDLFSCLSDNMWELPMKQAITDARLEELSLLSKLEQLKIEGNGDSESCPLLSKSADQVDTWLDPSGHVTTSLSGSLSSVASEEQTVGDRGGNNNTSENDTVDGVNKQDDRIINEDCMTQLEVTFDPEKCVCSSIEAGQSLIHSTSGKGYGIASIPITSGCYHWKFQIVKENKSNEGTCVGVCRLPVRDYGHRSTSDMWLYRAYSGNLYHNGEQLRTLHGFTQGDYITCVLDMDSKTLAFGKNGEEPRMAFEDIDATELYPCVTFYSSNPGEKVKISDMQIQAVHKDLLPGEPLCAPPSTVVCEALIRTVRSLHSSNVWTDVINEKIIQQLDKVSDLDVFVTPDVRDRLDTPVKYEGKKQKSEEENGDDSGKKFKFSL